MHISLTIQDFVSLSPAAQAEIMAIWNGHPVEKPAPKLVVDADYTGIDMEDREDLTPKQIRKWMEKASDKTKDGLRVFAELGPIVTSQQLVDAGIDNLGHFQSRVTMRTRTVSGDPDAYLFGWNEWTDGEGLYGITEMTYRSLRQYFGLPN